MAPQPSARKNQSLNEFHEDWSEAKGGAECLIPKRDAVSTPTSMGHRKGNVSLLIYRPADLWYLPLSTSQAPGCLNQKHQFILNSPKPAPGKKEPHGLPLVTGQDAYNLVIRLRLNMYSMYIYSRLELKRLQTKTPTLPQLEGPWLWWGI